MARTFVVSQPIVDLRSSPAIVLPSDYSHQEERETQLIQGEKLIFLEERGDWLRVGAIEQLRYTEQEGWGPYPGWVHCSEVQEGFATQDSHVVCTPGPLSYGTFVASEAFSLQEGIRIRPIPISPNREQMVREAQCFIGMPYLWGGRSLSRLQQASSVDCSGLVNLLYRAQGICIPRDAHDQYLISQPVNTLLPGDPLYLAKNVRVNHVVMKLDELTFIEAPETGKKVRFLKWGIDLWEEEGKIRIFDRPHLYTAYPRSFL